jgi:hypothetical protein
VAELGDAFGHAVLLYDEALGMSVEKLADSLHLRQDQTALGGACVDRRDENDGVARLNEVAHEGAVFGNAVCGEVDDGLAEVRDACFRFSVGQHDGDAVGAHARHEGFIGRVEVALVDDEDGGCAELAQVFDKVALTLIEVPGVGDDKRDVDIRARPWCVRLGRVRERRHRRRPPCR